MDTDKTPSRIDSSRDAPMRAVYIPAVFQSPAVTGKNGSQQSPEAATHSLQTNGVHVSTSESTRPTPPMHSPPIAVAGSTVGDGHPDVGTQDCNPEVLQTRLSYTASRSKTHDVTSSDDVLGEAWTQPKRKPRSRTIKLDAVRLAPSPSSVRSLEPRPCHL
jgi:hypothetical protein